MSLSRRLVTALAVQEARRSRSAAAPPPCSRSSATPGTGCCAAGSSRRSRWRWDRTGSRSRARSTHSAGRLDRVGERCVQLSDATDGVGRTACRSFRSMLLRPGLPPAARPRRHREPCTHRYTGRRRGSFKPLTIKSDSHPELPRSNSCAGLICGCGVGAAPPRRGKHAFAARTLGRLVRVDPKRSAPLPRFEEPGMRICIVGASGKLGKYVVQHPLAGSTRWSPCTPSRASASSTSSRAPSASCPARRTTARSSRAPSQAATAFASCSSPGASTATRSGTAPARLDHAEPEARLVFSCGWRASAATARTSTRGG